MSEQREHQYWETPPLPAEVGGNEPHPPIQSHQESAPGTNDLGAENEKSSSEVLQIYLKSLGYTCGKKRRRCISQELG